MSALEGAAAAKRVHRRGIVGAGGGGDDALAKFIAVSERRVGEVEVFAVGVGNHRSTFHKFLFSDDIRDLPHIQKEVGAKRPGFVTRAATDAYISDSLKSTAIRTFSVVSSNAVMDEATKTALGTTQYNSLNENRAVASADKQDTFLWSMAGGNTNKYDDADGAPMGTYPAQMTNEISLAARSMVEFVLEYRLDELVLVDVGGDITRIATKADVNACGRDEMAMLACLLAKECLTQLAVSVRVYGPGADKHDAPQDVIARLESLGFARNDAVGIALEGVVEEHRATLAVIAPTLLRPERATQLFITAQRCLMGREGCTPDKFRTDLAERDGELDRAWDDAMVELVGRTYVLSLPAGSSPGALMACFALDRSTPWWLEAQLAASESALKGQLTFTPTLDDVDVLVARAKAAEEARAEGATTAHKRLLSKTGSVASYEVAAAILRKLGSKPEHKGATFVWLPPPNAIFDGNMGPNVVLCDDSFGVNRINVAFGDRAQVEASPRALPRSPAHSSNHHASISAR